VIILTGASIDTDGGFASNVDLISSLYTAGLSGTSNYMGVRATATGNVKGGIYSGTTLLATCEGAVVAGANYLEWSTPVSITQGQDYRIVTIADTVGARRLQSVSPSNLRSHGYPSYSTYVFPSTYDWENDGSSNNPYFALVNAIDDIIVTGITKLIVYSGDSISSTDSRSHPYQCVEANLGLWDRHVVGVNGQRSDQLISQWSSNEGAITLSETVRNVLHLMIGTNDLAQGYSATAIYSNILTIVGLAQTAGYDDIVVSTVLPASIIGSATERNSLNTSIRNGADANGYLLSDPDDFTELQNTSDETYYYDGTHLDIRGSSLIAIAISKALGVASRVGGSPEIATTTNIGAEERVASKFRIPATARVFAVGVYANVGGGANDNAKLAVYSDDNDTPDALLGDSGGGVSIAAGYNCVHMSQPFDMAKDTYFWVHGIAQTAGNIAYRGNIGWNSGLYIQNNVDYASYSPEDPFLGPPRFNVPNQTKFIICGSWQPIIDDASDTSFGDGDSAVFYGRGFLDDPTTGTLEICPTSTYNAGTAVTQIISDGTNESLSTTIDDGGTLSGTCYAFYTNEYGQRSEPFSFTISTGSSGANDTPDEISISVSSSNIEAAGAVSDTLQGVSGSLAVSDVAALSVINDTQSNAQVSVEADNLLALSDISDSIQQIGLSLVVSDIDAESSTSRTDTLSGLSVSCAVSDIDEVSSVSDAPQVVSVAVSVYDIDAAAETGRVDTLQVVPLSVIVENIGEVSDISDSLAAASISVSVSDIDATDDTSREDTLSGLNLSAVVTEMEAVSDISEEMNQLSVSVNVSEISAYMGKTDTINGFLISAGVSDISSISEIEDSPGPLSLSLLVSSISANTGFEDAEVNWRNVRRILLKQVPYGADSVPLSFDYPSGWNPAMVAGVTVRMSDKDGNEVLAEDSCFVWPGTIINGRIDQWADEFVLADDTVSDPLVGDKLTLHGVSGTESVFVAGYDSSTKTVKVDSPIEHAFEDGAAVYGNVISYDLDISDTDTFIAGKSFVATWTPSGTGAPLRTILQVAKAVADTSSIERRFRTVYPRAYDAFTEPVNRLEDMVTEAQIELELDMLAEKMDYQRIVGEPVLPKLLMAKMQVLWTRGADEDLQDEADNATTEYARLFSLLQRLPIWTDRNQDAVQDETALEVTAHTYSSTPSW
jgi:lysophospholipase L1-like esterase